MTSASYFKEATGRWPQREDCPDCGQPKMRESHETGEICSVGTEWQTVADLAECHGEALKRERARARGVAAQLEREVRRAAGLEAELAQAREQLVDAESRAAECLTNFSATVRERNKLLAEVDDIRRAVDAEVVDPLSMQEILRLTASDGCGVKS